MEKQTAGFSEDSLIRAIESNGEEFLVTLGRAAGAEERNEPGVRWVIGEIPVDYHNCVVRADLSPEDADGVIAESLDLFRAHGAPGSWHVGPSTRPADIGERLLAHGFSYGGDDIGMAVELSTIPEGVPVPEGLQIARVRDEEDLLAWEDALGRGFGEGPREARWVAEAYRTIGLGDEGPWRHYLGRLGGAPVATSTLFLGAGVAGVYFVCTVEEVRRRGIGAALTLAPLREARGMGYRVGVLGASEMGYPVYRRLGFEERCRIGLYEWRQPGKLA